MAVYDEYQPVPPLRCPWCGAEAIGWQGKDGPCRFLLWRQGERHPVDQDVDEDVRLDPVVYANFTLPDQFDLVGWCSNEHTIRAVGRCRDGVWAETDTSDAERSAADDQERERVRRLRESWNEDRS